MGIKQTLAYRRERRHLSLLVKDAEKVLGLRLNRGLELLARDSEPEEIKRQEYLIEEARRTLGMRKRELASFEHDRKGL